MIKTRIAFVILTVSHYRKTFFFKLTKLPNTFLSVICGESSENFEDIGGLTKKESVVVSVRNKSGKLGTFAWRWQSGAFRNIIKIRPDIVVITGMPSVLSNWFICFWAKLTHRPVVMWVCGWEIHTKNTLSYFVKRMILRVYHSMATQILTYSTTAKSYLTDVGVSPQKMMVCYNGLETDQLKEKEEAIRFKATELRSKNKNLDVIFLFVGQMTPLKNVHLLIEAFSRVSRQTKKSLGLWLVGDGPNKHSLEKTVQELGIQQVSFFGERLENVDEIFAAADFFVLPGIGGLALNQSMQFGVPCICSEADGTENDLVINAKTGFRFETGSLDFLVEAMKQALSIRDTQEYVKMQDAAKEVIVSQSNTNKMVQVFAETFSKVTQK